MTILLIDSYEFGMIVIDGRRHTSDVIVFPDRVLEGWWRREGHHLNIVDLEKVFETETKPEVLVVGTGYSGIMAVSSEVREALRSRGIKLVAQPTRQACATFNELLKANRKVVAAFHLTC